MGNKTPEKKILSLVLKDSPRSEVSQSVKKHLKGTIIEIESPDFIIDKTGVEHFLVDMLFETKGRNAMSIERKTLSNISEQVKSYQENPETLDKDIENGKAITFAEDIISSEMKALNNFSCRSFIDNFTKIFDNHYEKVEQYKKKCSNVGFLIEIPYMPAANQGFEITRHGVTKTQRFKTIPIPSEIINHIYSAKKIEFAIVFLHPINDTGSKNDREIVYFDVTNRKISISYGKTCESFAYTFKYPSNGIKLQLVKDNNNE